MKMDLNVLTQLNALMFKKNMEDFILEFYH
jgi:hypothetical protein